VRIELTSLVEEVMRRRPETIRTFLDHRMRCVGCPVARFHSIAEACREHGVNPGLFMATLRTLISASREHDSTRGPRG
jgi:hybrid cluster-associated redox disulfide protein